MMGVRLQGAKRHAAERGELHFPLPVGLVYDTDGHTIIDPDEEVRAAIADVFKAFGRPVRRTAWSGSSTAGASPAAPTAARGRASCAGAD